MVCYYDYVSVATSCFLQMIFLKADWGNIDDKNNCKK